MAPKDRKRITVAELEAMKVGRDNGEIVIDPGERGRGALILRITDTAKPFYYRYFHNGKRRFELVGYFDPKGAKAWREDGRCHKGGSLTLIAAKEGYLELSSLARARGGDLKGHFTEEKAKQEEALKQAEIEARAGSFADMLHVYVAALRANGKASAHDVEKIFKRNVEKPFPRVARRKANEISAEDIQEILAKMVERGATRQVNVTRSYLHAAFNHAGETHDYDPRRLASDGKAFRLKGNPVALVPRIREYERTGERVLTADEIRAYAAKVAAVPSLVTRCALQLHLMTGAQRLTQLLAAPWSAYDFGEKALTLVDTKGKAQARAHLVPLLPEALKVLETVRPHSGGYTWPFTTFGKTSIRLETLIDAVREIAIGADFERPFTLRDIRRTVETTLASLGVSKEIRANLLSHGRGDKIDKTYNKYQYLNEKRMALQAWVGFVNGAGGKRANVRVLRPKKA